MNATRRALVLAPLVIGSLLAGCGEDPAPAGPSGTPVGAPPAAPPSKVLGADDLKAHFERVVELSTQGDRDATEKLVRSTVPSRDELRSVLRPGPETDAFLQKYEGPVLETLPPPDPLASVKKGGTHSVIRVHAATTEELAAYVKGTTAFQEFPGGMKRFAQTVAAPGRTWYSVETLEPGKEEGIRFTCLTALADRFILVVKPWRALPKEEAAGEGPPNAPK